MDEENPYQSPVFPTIAVGDVRRRKKSWQSGVAWIIPLVWIVAGCAPSFLLGGPLVFALGSFLVAFVGWWFTFAAFTRYAAEGRGLGELLAGIGLNLLLSLYLALGIWSIFITIRKFESQTAPIESIGTEPMDE